EQEFRLKTLFLAVHLVHRSLKLVVPNFVTDYQHMRVQACCCIYLACAVENEAPNAEILINYALATPIQFYDMLRKTLIAIEGIISTDTYWFHADTMYSSLGLLIDSFSCDYDLNRIRSFKGTEIIGKHLTVKELLKRVSAPKLLKRYYMNVIMKVVSQGEN